VSHEPPPRMGEPIPIRAAVVHRAGAPVVVEDLLLEPPHDDEVLVRVEAAGVCHSDLHLADGHLGPDRVPIVPGHEGAGVVEAVGARVSHVAAGDRVAFCFIPSCGACRQCLAGRTNLCETALTSNRHGTLPEGSSRLSLPDGRPVRHFLNVSCFAERCVVHAASAVPLPPGIPLWQAALIGCAVVTGLGAVRNAARVRLGDSVAVIGCGGVGLQAVAGARLAGAGRIIAVDTNPDKLRLARRHGATDTVLSAGADGGPVLPILTMTDGGVDHAIEVVGMPETIRQAFDMIRPGGTAVVVGVAPIGAEVRIPAVDFTSEKTLRGCFYGSARVAAEMPALMRMVAEGRLDLADAVSHRIELDGLEEAFERLRRGEGARSVVLFGEAAGEGS
jgi:S-(hydroxymethyl)glutathione dehydrogenase / alcohol dehydrogenase